MMPFCIDGDEFLGTPEPVVRPTDPVGLGQIASWKTTTEQIDHTESVKGSTKFTLNDVLDYGMEDVARLAEARRAASLKVDSALEYLTEFGINGVAQLNWLRKGRSRPELRDFKVPLPFHETIAEVRAMPIPEAKDELTYAILSEVQQRPGELRLQLRQVQHCLMALEKMEAAIVPAPIPVHASELAAHCMKVEVALHAVHEKLRIFADNLAAHINMIKREQAKVPKGALRRWDSSDENKKQRIMDYYFEQAIAKDGLVLGENVSTSAFALIRSLLLFKTWETLCERLGEFSEGLKEMGESF